MTVYLDNSATTRPCPAAAEKCAELLESGWYNPSALYKPALEIQKQIDQTREDCLKAAGAAGGRVIFTSGGTESDNLALLGCLRGKRPGGKVLISALEHPAISACRDEIERMGFRTEELPSGADGRIDLEEAEKRMTADTVLITVMQVNNETGAVEPLEEIAALRSRNCPEAAIHVDGVQGFLRVPVAMNRTGIQSYALSAHKIHGLKGTGALILAKGHSVKPIQFGGGQEGGLRSGTENTLGILAMGAAMRDWKAEEAGRIRKMKTILWEEISRRIPGAKVNGPDPESAYAAPHILNVAMEPVRSQTMLFALEGDGIYVSAGSACASRKQKISPVLKAMGVATAQADCSLRYSLGRETTEEEVRYAAERTAAQYELLKRYTRR